MMIIESEMTITMSLNELKVIYDAMGTTSKSNRNFSDEKETVFIDVYESIRRHIDRELWED